MFQRNDARLELLEVRKTLGCRETVRPFHLEDVLVGRGIESCSESGDPVAALEKPNHVRSIGVTAAASHTAGELNNQLAVTSCCFRDQAGKRNRTSCALNQQVASESVRRDCFAARFSGARESSTFRRMLRSGRRQPCARAIRPWRIPRCSEGRKENVRVRLGPEAACPRWIYDAITIADAQFTFAFLRRSTPLVQRFE